MYAQKRYQTIKSFFALHKIAVTIFVIAVLFLTQCSRDEEILDDTFYHLEIPEHFPYPEIPDDNILTKGKIELGKKLFFDKTLSIDSTIACASCHKPEHGFSDNIAISRGVENRTGFRNASSLTNVAYAPILLRDGGFPTLETQVAVPVQDHNEMDFNMLELSMRLKKDAYYKNEFINVFGTEPEPGIITKALAAF
ncbi:MAG: cytochrome-c peroxidase, partial [Fimbriimonadaceae bacterium]|nr:cytochrome-c peroxidase [Chitinophagales bacterium]